MSRREISLQLRRDEEVNAPRPQETSLRSSVFVIFVSCHCVQPLVGYDKTFD